MVSEPVEITAPLVLVWGEDDYTVKKRARQIFFTWSRQTGEFDQEIIDGNVANSGEALKALSRLQAALDSLPLFSHTKVVWLQNCNFLGEDRVATGELVTQRLTHLAQAWAQLNWQHVRLLLSATKVDKRRIFYKTLEKIGWIEACPTWSTADRDWASKAEAWVQDELRPWKKSITHDAAALLVAKIGPNPRLLSNEIEKLALSVGPHPTIQPADVEQMAPRQKQAEAFALAEALGDRDLARMLRALDEEYAEIQSDPRKSAIGVLYGLISKIRVLLLLKELVRTGLLKTEPNYARFKTQMDRLPPTLFPADKRLNPLTIHPYLLYKAQSQINRYSQEELIQAMESLLTCNVHLISSPMEEILALQHALVKIMRKSGAADHRVIPQAAPG